MPSEVNTGVGGPLTTALETKTFSVAVLLDAIRKGRVRIPRFQRQFRWGDEDRRLLFDSIQAGFPIGTLLLAQSAAPADRVVLGGFTAEVPAVENALWVVDGQQRLATLAMGLLDDGPDTHRPIYFDLESNTFVLGRRRRAPSPHWVPTHVLASSALLNKWLRQEGISEELSDHADEISRRIREYTVPAYLVPTTGEDDQILRNIFARVNRFQHALTSAEVFQALHTSRAGGKGPIDSVREDVAELGFGQLKETQVERVAVAVANLQPSSTLGEGLGKDVDVQALFARVSKALMRAVAFLVEDVGIPHISWLPYSGVLASLARLFDLHPEVHPRNRVLLVRWFWRGMLTGNHRTDNRTDGPKWNAIDGDEHATVQRLLKLLPKMTVEDIPHELSVTRSAQMRMELAALASLDPRMLVGDERGSPVALSSLLDHEAANFPAVITKTEKTVAALLLHPVISTEELVATAPSQELLATHGIDAEAFAALATGDIAAFVALRTKRLTAYIHAFLVTEAGIDAADHDRPPLDAYFTEEGA
ncbi:DUF262 domain-containing protein [Cystobacter ferrugineus]|uniref:GmrSD restriction endonucleases N-terminal domain-containing protein n=1 Tax=Cystobacter ferrugineus TaxID=83449 RepID=A0A1L9AXF3_9BACT|nr:DUF262 domain-containing protein [Cystobacter ferrugineus]OJH34680.1 hypothetical protein BON30_41705 [Cystobacter ferrugineus]